MREEQKFVLACPKCGGSLFVRTTQARGPWVEVVDGDGEIVDTCLDGLRYGPQRKWMRCAEACAGRVLNPKHQDATQAEDAHG